MKVEYFPSSDTLSIVLAADGATFPWGYDTQDEDVILFYDDDKHLCEILIAHASRRVDMAETRRRIGFEEVQAGAEEPA